MTHPNQVPLTPKLQSLAQLSLEKAQYGSIVMDVYIGWTLVQIESMHITLPLIHIRHGKRRSPLSLFFLTINGNGLFVAKRVSIEPN